MQISSNTKKKSINKVINVKKDLLESLYEIDIKLQTMAQEDVLRNEKIQHQIRSIDKIHLAVESSKLDLLNFKKEINEVVQGNKTQAAQNDNEIRKLSNQVHSAELTISKKADQVYILDKVLPDLENLQDQIDNSKKSCDSGLQRLKMQLNKMVINQSLNPGSSMHSQSDHQSRKRRSSVMSKNSARSKGSRKSRGHSKRSDNSKSNKSSKRSKTISENVMKLQETVQLREERKDMMNEIKLLQVDEDTEEELVSPIINRTMKTKDRMKGEINVTKLDTNNSNSSSKNSSSPKSSSISPESPQNIHKLSTIQNLREFQKSSTTNNLPLQLAHSNSHSESYYSQTSETPNSPPPSLTKITSLISTSVSTLKTSLTNLFTDSLRTTTDALTESISGLSEMLSEHSITITEGLAQVNEAVAQARAWADDRINTERVMRQQDFSDLKIDLGIVKEISEQLEEMRKDRYEVRKLVKKMSVVNIQVVNFVAGVLEESEGWDGKKKGEERVEFLVAALKEVYLECNFKECEKENGRKKDEFDQDWDYLKEFIEKPINSSKIIQTSNSPRHQKAEMFAPRLDSLSINIPFDRKISIEKNDYSQSTTILRKSCRNTNSSFTLSKNGRNKLHTKSSSRSKHLGQKSSAKNVQILTKIKNSINLRRLKTPGLFNHRRSSASASTTKYNGSSINY